MNVVHIDWITLEGVNFPTELTWLSRNSKGLTVASHLFVRHPGAEEAEKLLHEAFGQEPAPLLRYGLPTAFIALMTDIDSESVVHMPTERQIRVLRAHLGCTPLPESIKVPRRFQILDEDFNSDVVTAILRELGRARERSVNQRGRV